MSHGRSRRESEDDDLGRPGAEIADPLLKAIEPGPDSEPQPRELLKGEYERHHDAATGTPLWHTPDGAAPSSAVAVVGPNIFYGAGTTFSGQPPQAFGVWSYGLPSILP